MCWPRFDLPPIIVVVYDRDVAALATHRDQNNRRPGPRRLSCGPRRTRIFAVRFDNHYFFLLFQVHVAFRSYDDSTPEGCEGPSSGCLLFCTWILHVHSGDFFHRESWRSPPPLSLGDRCHLQSTPLPLLTPLHSHIIIRTPKLMATFRMIALSTLRRMSIWMRSHSVSSVAARDCA